MKTLFTLLTCLAFHIYSKAQQNSFNSINSTNVMDFYERTQYIFNEMKSADIAVQIGYGNIIEVQDRSPNFIELLQYGDYNTINFVNPNNYPTNAEINIRGTGNYIDIMGSNSISDGIKININANDMMLFMRNY